ncbi:hypothetical protein [Otariodibacter oris]|uniref:DUF2752 domain-containing protein n=1 Tax=Otariodibacter oris TaxID=1032623 RepID=A0A420XIU8_9PAST|nr:hypothetical protein [Otariodibacter oris]QGM80685.1 hypothetical protein A6A10_04335 [Otariodibacter oris]RKR77153.1 hypothetical protein DES31_0478 [Otariodibacter oris]
MRVKCPACGAVNSLDALIAHDAASEALNAALLLNGDLGKKLVSYLALFRPSKSALTFQRVTTLLNELQPMITAQQISRDGQYYPAPVEAWVYGFESVLAKRQDLKLPLNSHGYLLEIIKNWKPKTANQALSVVQAVKNDNVSTSKTVTAIQGAMQWANNG